MTHRLHPLFFAAAGPLVFSTAFAASVVDLDSPAAVERLQKEHPSQYDTVIRILRDAERLPEQRVEGWIRATYPAESVHLGQLLLVSYPPKRRLSFSLAGVSYYATVVVRLSPPTVDPVDPHVSEQSGTR
jgi:hypothetical protein